MEIIFSLSLCIILFILIEKKFFWFYFDIHNSAEFIIDSFIQFTHLYQMKCVGLNERIRGKFLDFFRIEMQKIRSKTFFEVGGAYLVEKWTELALQSMGGAFW